MSDIVNIDVFETIEEVTINATPNIIEVNINRITSTGAVSSVNGQTGDVIGLATTTYVDTKDALKVDKVTGKGLSTNDYTTAEQTKLTGIQAGAEININADWNATIGDAVIFNKPSIPSIAGLVPYTGAINNVDLGEKMLQTSKLKLYDMASGGDEIASIEYTDEAFIVKNSDGEVLFHIENGFIQLHNGSTIQSNLFTTLLTQVRDHYLPDKSGTIALTSDITGINSGTNTGDETATTIKSKLGITTLSGSNTGDNSTNTQYSGLATSKEDVANKSTSITTDQTSNIKYPSVKSVYDWAVNAFTTTSAVATQITTALTGYATQTYVNSQGFITNVITALGYTPLNKAGDTITGDIGNTTTGYFRLPNGTTAQRPGTPLNGMHRYNTDTLRDEFYTNGSWQNHARLTGDTFTGAISATNLSGSNTGNETSSTIATALGYTPSNDTTVVHLDGTETITGLKTFQGATQTGSSTNGILNFLQTWNTTGNPTAINVNITSNNDGGLSNLFRLQLSGTNRFTISKEGFLFFGGNSGGPGFFRTVEGTGSASADYIGRAVKLAHYVTSTVGYGIYFDRVTGTRTATSGENGCCNIFETFNPTSGNASYNSFSFQNTINQTGGANGITRGIYINPTLTAAVDFRAIEVTAGKVVFSATNTASGTTGAQTINKISGKVNAAATTTSLVVTNSLVTTSSIVMCQLGTNDATCVIKSVVEANGSFTIYYTAPTAETVIKFKVIN